MTNQIEKLNETAIQTPATTQGGPIAMASAAGASISDLKELWELQKEWEANEARKAYNAAIADFKSEQFEIIKDKSVGYKTKDGNFVGYKHATLAHIVDTVVPLLSKHGLTHSWESCRKDNMVSVTCKLSHKDGHSENVTLFAAPDNSGKKNAIQQVGSTITYLQRYTLQSILGLAAADQDDDGNAAEEKPENYINENHLADIVALISELDVNESAFCAHIGVNSLEEIPEAKYQSAVNALEMKRKAISK